MVAQVGESPAADMAEKMIEGPGDREGFLRGAGEVVQVMKDGRFQVAQVVVGRTATAQAQPEEEQAPPSQKATVIFDHRGEAGVGQLVQPVGQFREEMADGFEKNAGQVYDLPDLRRRAVTCVWTRARASWVI